MVTTKQKPVDIKKEREIKYSKGSTAENYQITKEKSKRKKGTKELKNYKTTRKQSTK